MTEAVLEAIEISQVTVTGRALQPMALPRCHRPTRRRSRRQPLPGRPARLRPLPLAEAPPGLELVRVAFQTHAVSGNPRHFPRRRARRRRCAVGRRHVPRAWPVAARNQVGGCDSRIPPRPSGAGLSRRPCRGRRLSDLLRPTATGCFHRRDSATSGGR